MPKPNFFIVGAPKCGTSAMYTFLKQHPDIFMPYRKEPHFFGQDLNLPPGFNRVTDLDDYLALFQPGEGKKRLGEASTQYINSQTAPKEIRAFAPEALIIVMLRNPVDRLYSGYFQRRFVGMDTAPTFETSLRLEAERKQGTDIPPDTSLVDVLNYRQSVSYTEAVRRYFDVFGRERVHVIIHDDMRADVAAVYRTTLEFLDVAPDFKPDFRVVNPHKEARSARMRRLMARPPGWYRAFLTVGRRLASPKARHRINQIIQRANTRYPQRPPMNPDTRRALQAYFLPEVESLGELLGRDLTHWCR